MKQLLTISALLVSSLAMGQWPSLPYNPDDNGDGFIGVVDLQGLLATYGSEFDGAIISENGESALVYVGEISHPACDNACNQLPGFWQLPRLSELTPLFEDMDSSPVWLHQKSLENDGVTYNNTTSRFPVFFPTSNFSEAYVAGHHRPMSTYSCYCAAKQLPRVEYFTCKASCSDGAAALDACVNDKLIEGWYPLQSQRQQQVYNDCFWQPLWRWVE